MSTPAVWRSRGPALWLALALCLGVAAFTHLTSLSLIEFKADEAQVAGLALDAAQGRWPAASIATSNGGLDNPPLPLYVFALASVFSQDPAWQAGVSGLLDVLALAITFWVGLRHFGPRTAIGTAACYAAAAYPAMFARKLAGPYLQPFFAALLLLCLLEVARGAEHKPPRWAWAGAVIALGALVQIHLGALLLAPVLAILLADDARRQRSWRPVLPAALGALIVAAGFAPYLAFEFSHRTNFLAMVGSYVQGNPAWTLEAFRFVWTTISSPGYGDLTGAGAGLFNAESWPAGLLTPLLGLAAVAGLFLAVLRWREPRYRTMALLVLLPPILTLHHGPGLQIHYFAFLLPPLFLLAGIAVEAALGTVAWLHLPLFALLGLLLAVQVAGFRHFSQFVRQHALADSYGLPLEYQQRLFDQAGAVAAGRRVVIGTTGRDQQEPARFFLRNQAHTETDAGEGVLLPAGGGVYVAFSRTTPAVHALEAGLEAAASVTLPGGGQAAVYDLPSDAPSRLAQVLALGGNPAVWNNGLRLLAAGQPRSLPAQLAAMWQVTAAVDASTLLFNQLVDDDGRQWFDHDGLPAEATDWRPGDALLTLTQATLPTSAQRQEYWWSTGVYVEGGRRVLLTSGDSERRVARLKGGAIGPARVALTPSDGVFGGAIQLRGYAIAPDAVTLEWQSVAPVERDLTVFVHAVEPNGRLAAQSDAQPAHYPTSLWDPGEAILDRHSLSVPAGARLEVGLYDLASGQRLLLPDGSDHVLIG